MILRKFSCSRSISVIEKNLRKAQRGLCNKKCRKFSPKHTSSFRQKSIDLNKGKNSSVHKQYSCLLCCNIKTNKSSSILCKHFYLNYCFDQPGVPRGLCNSKPLSQVLWSMFQSQRRSSCHMSDQSNSAKFRASVVLSHSCYVILGQKWPQEPSLSPSSFFNSPKPPLTAWKKVLQSGSDCLQSPSWGTHFFPLCASFPCRLQIINKRTFNKSVNQSVIKVM